MRTIPIVALLALCAVPASAKETKDELPKLAEQVKGWTASEGYFRLYRKEGEERLLAAIPKDQLGEAFFLATSISGGSDYAGWQWQDKLVRFERFNKKLLLVELNTRQRAEDGQPLTEVVRRTYADRLLASLDIKGQGEDEELLVDLGALLTRQYGTFFGGPFAIDSSLARFAKVKPFPQNLEVSIQAPSHGDGTFLTLHYSISKLPPLEDYKPRVADERVGYFTTPIRDYTSGDAREGRMVRYVNRWKLEKADPDLALSPPKEPIVFYVEKTVPIAYRGAVAAGILEWNKAFEKVGISGAIVVRQQTDTQFADLDPEDTRYNFFRWITSERAFAMGPSRVDPRSGRILDADIIFDDSMLRGYMSDYDVLIREAPAKMLSAPMQQLLAQKPELHPLARFRGQKEDPALTRMRGLVRDVLADPELPAAAALKAIARGEPQAHRQIQAASDPVDEHAACRLGEMMPQQVGLMGLTFGLMAREAGPRGKTVGSGAELFDDYVAQIVKETVMHEVGHTIGLRHNFKASAFVDLKTFNTAERPQDLSASVMDYHPVNLSSGDPDQPQGYFQTQTIGKYDYVAIEYGYSLHEEGSDELKAIPQKMAEQGLPYATDEDLQSPDPYISQWDLGGDPIAFARDRTKLVKKLWRELEKRSVADGESYSKLRRALSITLFEIQQSALRTAKLVGGLSFARDRRGDPNGRPPVTVVPAAKQREAVSWLCENVFAPESFDLPGELLDKLAASRWVDWGSGNRNTRLDFPMLDVVLQIQTWSLFFLTSDDVLARIWENEQRARAMRKDGAEPIDAPLTLPELFDTLENALFAELKSPAQEPTALHPAISAVRQNLQDAYVRRMIQIALGNGVSPPVANKLAWSRLKELERKFQPVLAGARLDPYTRAHLEVLETQSKAARAADYVHIASGVQGCALSAPASGSSPWAPAALALAGLTGLVLLRRRAALAA